MRISFHVPWRPERWAVHVNDQVTNGQSCRELENKVAQLHGADHAIACSSGTMGLFIALRAYSQLVGSHIYIPSFTWKSIREVVECIPNLHVKYMETDVRTWHPAAASGDRMNHWTFGSAQPTEADSSNFIITDMACGIGVKQEFGDIGVISLSPTKGVTAGEGGIILTNDEHLARYMTVQRDLLSRMSEFNAAYGIATLAMLDVIVSNHKSVAYAYIQGLKGAFKSQRIPLETNWSKFGVVCRDAPQVIKALTEAGVETRKYYEPISPHAQGSVSQALYDSIICLPIYQGVPATEIAKICNEAL